MGLAVLIEREGYRLVADSKVLKRAELNIVHDVSQALALAQERLAATQAEAEQTCAQRAADGYEDGLAQAARQAAQQLTLIEVDRLGLLESLRPVLAELVVDAVVLLAKGLDREAVFAQALLALQAPLRDASWARLRVHPSAAPTALDALDAFTRDSGLGTLARVVADETLPVDACVFESEFGRVDASLQTQIGVIRAAIDTATRRLVRQVPSDARARA